MDPRAQDLSSPYPRSTHTHVAQISLVADKFKAQFSDLDVQRWYVEDTMRLTKAMSTPQDHVDLKVGALMQQMTEEANIEHEPNSYSRPTEET